MTKVYLPSEAAEIMRMSNRQMLELLRRGDIPCVRLGRKTIRIPSSAIDQLLS